MTTESSRAPVYLDYAATAQVMPAVAQRMAEVLAMPPGNSSANHAAGNTAQALIEAARAQVAALIGADPADIVFTSGATESNNLAITGTARAALARGIKPHVITLATEHKSVLETVRDLASQGISITVLKPDSSGLLDAEALASAIQPNTCLVSLLHVNNETGVAQDLDALRAVCRSRAVPLHVDAAQSAGKMPLDVRDTALLSFTAHKLGGPQGIGALYVAPSHRGSIKAQLLGGGHERGLRAGTLATHQIVGFGLACELASGQREAESARLSALRERLWRALSDLPGAKLNGHASARVPGILNVTFAGVEGESLFTGLNDLILATGSACNSRSGEPSYVLRALGRDTGEAQSSLRLSLGWASTENDITAAIHAVRRVHAGLWKLSPARPAPVGHVLGEAGAERLGTWVRFAARVENGQVRDVSVQVFGCPHVTAACSHVAERIKGQHLTALAAGSPEEWRLAVHAPVEKLGTILIIEDALAALCRGQIPRS
ncbi:MAG: aminotransferase class V-fold PLP-dependent enzyme [Pseudomonadota bacterium]